MERHALTAVEQLRGIRSAIASPRTPSHLRSFLKKRRRELLRKVESDNTRNREQAKRRRANRKRPPGLLDWLGF